MILLNPLIKFKKNLTKITVSRISIFAGNGTVPAAGSRLIK